MVALMGEWLPFIPFLSRVIRAVKGMYVRILRVTKASGIRTVSTQSFSAKGDQTAWAMASL